VLFALALLFVGANLCLSSDPKLAFTLELAAGVLFRPWPLAAFIIVTGTQVGVMLAFAVGRSYLRPLIRTKFENDVRFVAVDNGVAREGKFEYFIESLESRTYSQINVVQNHWGKISGWKIPLLLRLQPVIPFGACSYILSLTAIKVHSNFVQNLR
jgi:uncharacterized membrane protein YdjX (TVP38/TMEM64 family)